MAKRTIEIDDTLDERIEAAKSDLREWAEQNPEDTEPHDMIFEIADSSTPIYTSEIDGLWYLYGAEFEEAYRDAGIGNGDEDNHQQAAIFCYIEQVLWDEWRNIEQEREDANEDED